MTSVVGAAIEFRVPWGRFSGRQLAEVYLDVEHGRRWLRHYAKYASDPAFRTAARIMYGLYSDEPPLPEIDLDEDLAGVLALKVRSAAS